MHLQEAVAGTSRGQRHEVQADAAAPARGHGEGEEETCGGQLFRLDAMAGGAGPHVLPNNRLHVRPPHEAPSEGERLFPAEVPTERRCVELLQHESMQVTGRGDAQAVAPEPRR